MSCHSQIWTNAEMLEPVRASWRTGQSLEWTRVHDLPDFVYFNHSIHVNKGIGCSTCHGRVDQMPLTYKVNTLYMQWCVNCHRDPAQYVRPRDQVFNTAYQVSRQSGRTGKAAGGGIQDSESDGLCDLSPVSMGKPISTNCGGA